MTRIGYLAHNLGDPAIRRRTTALRLGGADVRLAGFRRGATPPDFGPASALDLGRTEDARLARRLPSVGRVLAARMGALARHMDGAEALLARNLEMLAIGASLAERMRPRPRLVYECLDIHRLMTGDGVLSRSLRALESRLGRRVDLVLTSSPDFVERHLGPVFGDRVMIVENKVLAAPDAPPPAPPTPAGPPWRIGWFGALRCRRSLELLRALASRAEGRIEIVLRGAPSPAIFPDLAAELRDRPAIRFDGPYDNARDLPRIYGEVHFSWCVDFYEEGLNSSWLLPNRLYESALNATPPIVLRSVAAGRRLDGMGVGLVLDCEEVDPAGLARRLSALGPDGYARACSRLAAVPRGRWELSPEDCRDLVGALTGAAPSPDPATSPTGRADRMT